MPDSSDHGRLASLLLRQRRRRTNPYPFHCRKGDRECKYWLDREHFDLDEAYAYNLSPRDRREIKKIIFDHFEYLEQEWEEFQRSR